MRRVIVMILVSITSLTGLSDTNEMTRTGLPMSTTLRRLAKAAVAYPEFHLRIATGDERTTILTMDLVQSEPLRRIVPGTTYYRLLSSKDFIHEAKYSALLIDTNGVPIHLGSKERVIAFLNETKYNVNIKDDAKILVQGFADMCSYKIVEERPSGRNVLDAKMTVSSLDTDYKLIVADEGSEWRVYATMLVNDYSNSIMRFVFAVDKGPGSRTKILEQTIIHVGTLVL